MKGLSIGIDCGSLKVGFCVMDISNYKIVMVRQVKLLGKELGERLWSLYDEMETSLNPIIEVAKSDGEYLFPAIEDAVLRRTNNNMLPLLESRAPVRMWFRKKLDVDPACIAVTECRKSLGIKGTSKKPEAQKRVSLLYPEYADVGEDALDSVAVALAMAIRAKNKNLLIG